MRFLFMSVFLLLQAPASAPPPTLSRSTSRYVLPDWAANRCSKSSVVPRRPTLLTTPRKSIETRASSTRIRRIRADRSISYGKRRSFEPRFSQRQSASRCSRAWRYVSRERDLYEEEALMPPCQNLGVLPIRVSIKEASVKHTGYGRPWCLNFDIRAKSLAYPDDSNLKIPSHNPARPPPTFADIGRFQCFGGISQPSSSDQDNNLIGRQNRRKEDQGSDYGIHRANIGPGRPPRKRKSNG